MTHMNIKDFTLVKNRQRPEFCYSYEKKTPDTKHSIFTMDGGKTFLASIEEIRMDGKFYTEYSDTFNCVDDCLKAFSIKL